MRIILTFLLNAGLNFGVGLALAAVLGPVDYGRYAVGASAGALLATGCFDWLRLSTTRFYGDAQGFADPGLRATLDRLYMGAAAVLAGAGVLSLVVPLPTGVTLGLIGAVLVTAVANGAFDFRAALARARFHDGAYSALVIGKGVAGLGFGVGAAFLAHDPVVTLAAQAFGTVLAIMPVRAGLATERSGRAAWRLARRFAAYGLPIVTANVLFQGILLLNRSVAAARFGYAGAGHLSLATDIDLRLMLAVGAAVDVLVFQLAVRSEAAGGGVAAKAQLRTNMVHVAAVLLLLAVGLAGALPAFTALMVPLRFRDGFVPLAGAVLPGIMLFCLGQFAINPVFQMAHRTAPIIAGALVSAALDVAGLLVLPPGAGPFGLALTHSASLAGGVLLLAVLAFRDSDVRPARSDVVGLAVAGAAALVAVWPTRWIESPTLSLALAAAGGTSVYVLGLALLDVGDLRMLLRQGIGRGRGKLEVAELA